MTLENGEFCVGITIGICESIRGKFPKHLYPKYLQIDEYTCSWFVKRSLFLEPNTISQVEYKELVYHTRNYLMVF
jgi:hypothetical protein